jgi:hypothetical protein
MAFKAADLREEIEEMFGEMQVPRDAVTHSQRVFAQDIDEGRLTGPSRAFAKTGLNLGFRVFNPNPEKSDKRKADMRRYERGYADAAIRVRILAGERPKMGGRGRPPTRWFKVAESLGIDLRAPLAPAA